MKSVRGFSLIELVIVVIILGLLAVTALPRFMSLTSQAEDASVEGVAGGFASAVGLVRAQWEVSGRVATGTDLEIDTDGTTVRVGTTGYPTAVTTTADETNMATLDCLEVWNTIFQQPPTITESTTVDIDDDDYFVIRAGGAGQNARCVYYQIASIGLENGDTIPSDADGNNNGTYGKGFNYYPFSGRVFTFSNDD